MATLASPGCVSSHIGTALARRDLAARLAEGLASAGLCALTEREELSKPVRRREVLAKCLLQTELSIALSSRLSKIASFDATPVRNFSARIPRRSLHRANR